MKTENNLGNKAAFFAQYYKQKVMRCYTPTSVSEIMYVDPVAAGNYEYFLELTPLSQISDEDIDAIDLPYISIKDHLLNDIISQYEADYLRSKGYAVPWRDLSVDDLIAYGWVKLKNRIDMKEIIDSNGEIVNIGDKVRGEGYLTCNGNFKIDRSPVVTVTEKNGIIYFGRLSMQSFDRFWKVQEHPEMLNFKIKQI